MSDVGSGQRVTSKVIEAIKNTPRALHGKEKEANFVFERQLQNHRQRKCIQHRSLVLRELEGWGSSLEVGARGSDGDASGVVSCGDGLLEGGSIGVSGQETTDERVSSSVGVDDLFLWDWWHCEATNLIFIESLEQQKTKRQEEGKRKKNQDKK